MTDITYIGTIAQWEEIEKEKRWDSNTGNYTVICTDGKLDKDGNGIKE